MPVAAREKLPFADGWRGEAFFAQFVFGDELKLRARFHNVRHAVVVDCAVDRDVERAGPRLDVRESSVTAVVRHRAAKPNAVHQD